MGREGGLSVQRWAVHVRGFAHNGVRARCACMSGTQETSVHFACLHEEYDPATPTARCHACNQWFHYCRRFSSPNHVSLDSDVSIKWLK